MDLKKLSPQTKEHGQRIEARQEQFGAHETGPAPERPDRPNKKADKAAKEIEAEAASVSSKFADCAPRGHFGTSPLALAEGEILQSQSMQCTLVRLGRIGQYVCSWAAIAPCLTPG